MTATDEKTTSRGDYSEGISIETSKVIQGMSLVFAGAMTMLEAIHPKISVEPAELMYLMTGDKEGLMKLAEKRKAEAATDSKETKDANETTPDGAVDAVPDADVAHADGNDAVAEMKEAPAAADEPTTTLTVDDITKVIVQKIKQNRSNNEKIGQVLKAYGASKVSDLPASKYEAFLTDLAAI